MNALLAVCGAILLLLVVAAALYAAGLPGYQAVAFTLFGGCIAAVLGIAIRIAVLDRTRHVD